MADRVRTAVMYAQDSQGLGHINRTLTIARGLLGVHPDLVVYLLTKSPITRLFVLPERCDYIKLPTRLTPEGIAQSTAERDAARERFRRLRSQLLTDAVLGLAPDLVLVDHEPLGYAGELSDGLWTLKRQCPGTRLVLGLRDIMDHPVRIRAQWRELGVYPALEQLYDGIALFGLRRLYDVVRAYDLAPAVEAKLHDCGYIVRPPPSPDAAALRREVDLAETGPLVVAAVGSGSDGYAVLAATLAALGQRTDVQAVLVTGPFMPAAERAELRARARENVRVLERADTYAWMAAADAIVTMGGYNSVYEALAAGKRPPVIVPRATHKVEQRIRAEMLAAHGLARVVSPGVLDGDTLADALEWALGCDPAVHRQRTRRELSFDGAERATEYLDRWLGRTP